MSTTQDSRADLRVGIIGFGWMGQVHARALMRLPFHYPEIQHRPVVAAVCDAVPERLAMAREAFGITESVDDWRTLVSRPDLDAICVTGPNFIHRDVAVAAAQAGKHLWIEKPAGRSLSETQDIQNAVRAAGVHCTVGFQYRCVPAVALLKSIIDEGRLGEVFHVDVRFLTDYAADPHGAHSWRFTSRQAGTGVIGDLVSHAVDLVAYLIGTPVSLIADQAIFIPERPVPEHQTSHFGTARGGTLRQVENEDYVNVLLRFGTGARGTVQSSRVAVGEQNNYGVEIHGSAGQASWNFRTMGQVSITDGSTRQDAATSEVFVGTQVGDYHRFQPGAAIPLGYDDLKVIEAAGFVRSIVSGQAHGATIDDAVVAAILAEAIVASSQEHRWVDLPLAGGGD